MLVSPSVGCCGPHPPSPFIFFIIFYFCELLTPANYSSGTSCRFYKDVTQRAIQLVIRLSVIWSSHLVNSGKRHPNAAYYSFVDPGGMKSWVGLVGWPIRDGFLHISGHPSAIGWARAGKVHRPKNDVLPLCHATKVVCPFENGHPSQY